MADANAYNALLGDYGDPSYWRTPMRQPNALYDGGPVWENNHAAPVQQRQRPADWSVTSGIAEAISPTMGAYGMGAGVGSTYAAARAGDYSAAAENALPLAMAMFPMWGRPKGTLPTKGDLANALAQHQPPGSLGSGQSGHMPALSAGPQGQAAHTNSPNVLLSGPSSISALPDHLRQAVEAGQVPEGWYVHGRNGANNLRTDAVIQATRDLDVADQYAGKKGSGWLLQPSDQARVAEFSDGSYDLRKVAQLMMSDYRKGLLPHDLQQAVEKPSPGQFHDLARGFAPEKIVDSAQWFDNPDVAQWLHDRAKVDFARTPDGAVVLNPDAITTHQYFSRSPDVAAEQPKGIRAYHGSPNRFDTFGEDGPHWFATDEQTATAFGRDRMGVPQHSLKKPNMYEANISGNVLDVDPWAAASEAAQGGRMPKPETWDDVANILQYGEWQNGVLRDAQDAGHSAVRFKNVGDSPNGRTSDHVAVLDPATIEILRKYGLLGPMAGGVGVNALYGSENQ